MCFLISQQSFMFKVNNSNTYTTEVLSFKWRREDDSRNKKIVNNLFFFHSFDSLFGIRKRWNENLVRNSWEKVTKCQQKVQSVSCRHFRCPEGMYFSALGAKIQFFSLSFRQEAQEKETLWEFLFPLQLNYNCLWRHTQIPYWLSLLFLSTNVSSLVTLISFPEKNGREREVEEGNHVK